MSRFTLTTCLSGLLALSPAVEVLAADVVPTRPVSAQSRVLERLVGTWDTQISGGSADAFSKPTAIGRITRQWVADRKFVEETAGDHEAFFTYDTSLRTYRAWYFHSNGHVWELTGRATARFGVVGVRTTVASVGAFRSPPHWTTISRSHANSSFRTTRTTNARSCGRTKTAAPASTAR